VKRLSKVILIALAVLVGLGAVTVGALLVYLRSDNARQRIEVAVTKALKTRVNVGKVELSSWNAVRAESITVPTLDGSAALVSAPTFDAKFRYGPLLSGNSSCTTSW
jgi:archaellum component FlaF (FlaF/FlaG flagellin family)